MNTAQIVRSTLSGQWYLVLTRRKDGSAKSKIDITQQIGKLFADSPAWAYAIETPGGDMYDGEYAVFSDRQSAQDQVDNLNDDIAENEEQYKIVPLYRITANGN